MSSSHIVQKAAWNIKARKLVLDWRLYGNIANAWKWPNCGSEDINLLAEYRPLNTINRRTTSKN